LPARRSVPASAAILGPPPAPEALTGAAFAAAVCRVWTVDDVVGIELATAAGHALDRLRECDALLDGVNGLLVKAATGTISAAHVQVVLQARRLANADFAAALDRLELDRTPAALPTTLRGAG